MSEVLTGKQFKAQLREGRPKFGLFVNSHSPTVAEQLAHSGYDWLLVDTQHGPMGYETLSGMLAGIQLGGAKSLVRVGMYTDRPAFNRLWIWAPTASFVHTSTRRKKPRHTSAAAD